MAQRQCLQALDLHGTDRDYDETPKQTFLGKLSDTDLLIVAGLFQVQVVGRIGEMDSAESISEEGNLKLMKKIIKSMRHKPADHKKKRRRKRKRKS